MRFCDKCGNLLIVEKRARSVALVCRKCHKEYKGKEKLEITEKNLQPKKEIVVIGKDEGFSELPKTKIMCPHCEHMEAFWWMQQTRAADEPPTMFYRCTKCSYSWRSYG